MNDLGETLSQLIFIAALVFMCGGMTINGRMYGITSCNCGSDKPVQIEWGTEAKMTAPPEGGKEGKR